MSKQDLALWSFLEGMWLELRRCGGSILKSPFRFSGWHLSHPSSLTTAITLRSHCAMFILKDPDLLAILTGQDGPGTSVVLIGFLLLGFCNGALEYCLFQGKSWKMSSVHSKGGHLSLCKKKQRKLEGQEEKYSRSAQLRDMNNKRKRQDNTAHTSSLPPDGFLGPDSCPPGDMAFPFPWSLTRLGTPITKSFFLNFGNSFICKLIWKGFCYFQSNKSKSKTEMDREDFMPIKKISLDTQRKPIMLLSKAIRDVDTKKSRSKTSRGISSP